MYSPPNLKLISTDHHRNGVSGEPFQVTLFKDAANSGNMIAIDFGDNRFAVLNTEMLGRGDIEFMSNSWRGDYYAPFVRKLIEGEMTASEKRYNNPEAIRAMRAQEKTVVSGKPYKGPKYKALRFPKGTKVTLSEAEVSAKLKAAGY